MFKKSKVCTGVLLALGGGLLLAVPSAFAQSERIEITGSRIKSINGSSASPVTSLSEAQINSSQPVAIEEVIRTLPSAVPAIGAGTNNGTGGGATIDLRGLGTNRTLVLINGRRMVPFDLNAVVDTNTIPIALLSRADITTGGASAVYGADAVSGVVNFVLKRDFQGVEASGFYGMSGEGDAKRRRADLTIGSSLADGKGNVVLSVGATRTQEVTQGKRDVGLVSRSSTSGAPQGSFTTVPVYLDSAQISYQLLPNGDPDLSGNADTFNFNPLNFYQTPLGRVQATALASYTISDAAQVYADVFFTRSNVISNLAPSGTFFNTYSVPIGNPYITPALRADICTAYSIAAADCVAGAGGTTEFSVDIGRRFVELGPRVNEFRNKTFQVTTGIKGTVFGGWNYDAYVSRGEAQQNQILKNWGSSSKVQQALRATDTATCLDSSNGCVPINMFGAAGTISPAMLKFINLNSITTVDIIQDVFSASVGGDLGPAKSPLARDPIGLSLGVESRKMTAGNFSDASAQINGEILGTGAPAPDTNGTFKLNEFYGEVKIPLLSNLPGAFDANLDLGFRQSEFKTSSTTNYSSWKFGGDWSPVKGFRIRAMGQRATRAPNVGELFNPVVTQLDNLATDPCAGTAINAGQANTPGTLSNLCRLTGVPVARFGTLPQPSAGQVNVLNGGNTALKPEEADTLTVGFVFEPAFAPGLSMSLDYYKIDIEKAISNPSVADVMNDCYSVSRNPSLGFNAACAGIGRGPGGTFNGSSSPGILLTSTNQGTQSTSGFDLAVNYRLNLKSMGAPTMGVVDIGFDLNSVEKYWFQASPNSVQRDCLGYYSVACGAPNFEQKFSQRTTWTVGDFRVGYLWRYMSAVDVEPGSGTWFADYRSIKAYQYVDLSANWRATKNIRLNLSINNAFDKKPPAVGNTISTTTANSGNTFPQTYDAIGRFFTLGANLTF